MGKPQDPEAAETVQTTNDQAVDPAAICCADWRLISLFGYPEDDEDVLVVLRGSVHVCHYEARVGCWYAGVGGNIEGPFEDDEIDYWSPLPELPEFHRHNNQTEGPAESGPSNPVKTHE